MGVKIITERYNEIQGSYCTHETVGSQRWTRLHMLGGGGRVWIITAVGRKRRNRKSVYGLLRPFPQLPTYAVTGTVTPAIYTLFYINYPPSFFLRVYMASFRRPHSPWLAAALIFSTSFLVSFLLVFAHGEIPSFVTLAVGKHKPKFGQ